MDAIGPYRIIAKLGEGGMGEVHLAEDTRLERRVAIKRLRDVTGPEAIHRIRAEARAAARLTHPSIAAVYDVIETPAGPAIVMEYVEGAPLSSRLPSAPLPVPEVLQIGAQLADALTAAHAHGVVHRDLKPANVCVCADGTVKILDFGLARVRGTGSTATGAPSTHGHPMVGTPGYCAPEQWQSGVADARSDLFSLGIILFELCTRQRPFGAAYAEGAAPRADRINAAVPAPLAILIDRLVQLDPLRRPASAREVHAALQRLSAAPAGGPDPPRQQVSRKAAVLIAAVVIAAAGAPFLLRSRTAASGPPVIAVLPVHADEAAAPIAAGLDQSLASDLALMPGLVTIARDALLRYRGTHAPLDRVAEAVGAQYLVDGDVRQENGAWHLDVRLAHAGREDPVWRRQYSARADGFLAVRDRISDDLAAALGSDASLPRPARRVPTDNAEAFTHYSQAVAFMDRRDIPGNVDRAIRLFRSAVEKDGRFALAHAGLAQAYWRRYEELRDPEMPRLAERAILDAVTLDPEHPSVRYTAAVIFNGTGRADRAVEQLQRVIAAHPSDAAYRLLADITAARGDVPQALAYADRAIAIRPGFWENHGARGVIALQHGRLDEAEASFRRVTALQPDSAWGHQLLGTTQHSAGDIDAALASYQRALDLAPSAGALSNMATAQYAARRYGAAAASYEAALKLRPNEPRLLRNLGDTYARLGERRRAADAYGRALVLTREALAVNPENAPAAGVAALLEAKLGRHRDARRTAERALAMAPDNPEVLYRGAVVAALAGDEGLAAERLRRALERGYSRAVAADDEDLGPVRELAGLIERD